MEIELYGAGIRCVDFKILIHVSLDGFTHKVIYNGALILTTNP
jgi:hypothetical protein